MTKLTHIDGTGAARMVDVSNKAASVREASAEATIVLNADTFSTVASGEAPKGDVLAAARIAGIMAAKKTFELIPLCHPIPLSSATIEFELLDARHAIKIVAKAKTKAETGVEMEALVAASVAALAIYDMVKAMDRSAVVESVRLLAKSGGKSGDYRRDAAAPRRRAKTALRPRPAALVQETAPRRRNSTQEREAFREFMTRHRLRATQWAKDAGVPAAQLYAYLTGRLAALPAQTMERLARSAGVRPEDMFGPR